METGLCEYLSLLYETSTLENRIRKMADGLGKLLEYYQNNQEDDNYILTTGGYRKKIIFKNDKIEVIMLKWPINAITPKHDHPATGCWLAVIDGLLEEYDSSGKFVKNMKKWHISYREGSGSIHQLKAIVNDTWTISVNTTPGFYDGDI